MALKSKNKVSANFNMSSMTDIVFLLLIFFMLTSTLVTQNALDLLLAKSSSKNTDNPPISIQVEDVGDNNQPIFYIDSDHNNPIEIKDLENILLNRLKTKEESDREIMLEIDKRVDWEHVVKVMDIASKNNLKIVAATDPLK